MDYLIASLVTMDVSKTISGLTYLSEVSPLQNQVGTKIFEFLFVMSPISYKDSYQEQCYTRL